MANFGFNAMALSLGGILNGGPQGVSPAPGAVQRDSNDVLLKPVA